MMTPLTRTSRFATAVVLAATVMTACSSDGSTSASSSSATSSTTNGARSETGEPDPQAFSQCMRDNGIADFPDPGPDGLSINGLGIDVDSPEFQEAQEACEDLMPQPGGSGPAPAGAADWEKVVPGGDCKCADGSDYAFWVRDADPTKVVLYLEGGGGCFDATTCAFTGDGGESDFYDWSISGETPGLGGGIFDFDRADNPFADYSFVWASLCTGDAYLGDKTRAYTPELTVEHKGFADGTAALDYLAERYPDAERVVVLGKTAGSIAAPVYGGLAADLMPDAQVTVLGVQGGGFPDDPDLNADILGEQWGAYDTMPDWDVNDGLTARDWGGPRLWVQAGLHDPDIVMARFDYAYDSHAARWAEVLAGVDPSDLLDVIDANQAMIEAAGVDMHSYTAPGDDHGILELDAFYELEVGGVRLVDWVRALLDGTPPDDVHCDDCEAP